MSGWFAILSHGFGRVSGAFGAGWVVIEEVGHFGAIPCVGLLMVLIKFDFQVYLHL